MLRADHPFIFKKFVNDVFPISSTHPPDKVIKLRRLPRQTCKQTFTVPLTECKGRGLSEIQSMLITILSTVGTKDVTESLWQSRCNKFDFVDVINLHTYCPYVSI